MKNSLTALTAQTAQTALTALTAQTAQTALTALTAQTAQTANTVVHVLSPVASTPGLLNANRNGFVPRFEPRARARLGHKVDLEQLVFDPFYSQRNVKNRWDGTMCQDVDGPFDGFQFIAYMNIGAQPPNPEFTYFTVAGPELKWKDLAAAATQYCRITGDVDHSSIENIQIVRVEEHADHFYRLRGSLAPKDYPPLRIAICHISLGS